MAEELKTLLKRDRARLVEKSCWSFGLASLGLILVWRATGDLEWETVVAAAVLGLILAGIGFLARRGHSQAAAWILVGLLMLLVSADTWGYSLGEPGAAAYVLPIVLAGLALGWKAGIGMAGLASALVWLLAWMEVNGQLPGITGAISHLTFNAPFYTVIFFIVAIIAG
jgi:hypothetical protein